MPPTTPSALRSPVIGIGASAGGIPALRTLMAALPVDLPAAVLVVLHLSASGSKLTADVLDRMGPMPVQFAADGMALERGQVYTSLPDRHLIVRRGRLQVDQSPPCNGYRPAVDVTLTSIARAYRTRAVGVILSGTLEDGTEGMRAIKAAGGRTYVQDPAEAKHDGMIESALDAVDVDAVLRTRALASELIRLSTSGAAPTR